MWQEIWHYQKSPWLMMRCKARIHGYKDNTGVGLAPDGNLLKRKKKKGGD